MPFGIARQFSWRKSRKLYEEADELSKRRLYENWAIFLFGFNLGRTAANMEQECKEPVEEFPFDLVFRGKYPDAILVNAETRETLNVEFEEFSSGFKKQKHDPRKCDLIVCIWDDWSEQYPDEDWPTDVYELTSGELRKATWKVFQYGSNTHEARINDISRLNGDAQYLCNARTVQDYELDFTVWSCSNRCAAADIAQSKSAKVWGVVYEIPYYLIDRVSAEQRGRKSLDAIEGEGKNYRRSTIEVETGSGERFKALTYIGIEKREGLKTSREYAEHIVRGLEEHNIPKGYITKVKQKIADNNPDLKRYFL